MNTDKSKWKRKGWRAWALAKLTKAPGELSMAKTAKEFQAALPGRAIAFYVTTLQQAAYILKVSGKRGVAKLNKDHLVLLFGHKAPVAKGEAKKAAPKPVAKKPAPKVATSARAKAAKAAGTADNFGI